MVGLMPFTCARAICSPLGRAQRSSRCLTAGSLGALALALQANAVWAQQQPQTLSSDPRPPVSKAAPAGTWSQNLIVKPTKPTPQAPPLQAPTPQAPTPQAKVAPVIAPVAKDAVPVLAIAPSSPIKPDATVLPITPEPLQDQASGGWSAMEISVAQASCKAALAGKDIMSLPVKPFKEGECGAAAPIELISVGRNPQVTFSPPVTITCETAAALHTWVTRDLQPLARTHLGAPLLRIETMSSYSCRNAYGRAKSKLSEHGRANAVDIRGFVTASATSADLLADWGLTQRDIASQVAIAKAAQQKQDAERALAAVRGPQTMPQTALGLAPTIVPPAELPKTAIGLAPSSAGGQPAPGTFVRPNVTIGGSDRSADGLPGSANGGLQWPIPNQFPGGPSRLGGPPAPPEVPSVVVLAQAPKTRPFSEKKAIAPAGAPLSTAEGRSKFLRGAHASACKIFGTTLGPETNNAHRNHFHVDMAVRRNLTTGICE